MAEPEFTSPDGSQVDVGRRQRTKMLVARMAAAILALATFLLIAGLVFVDRETWQCSHRLSTALTNARKVEFVEYVGDVEIARKTGTPNEVARLQNLTRNWWRPFLPTSGYLCFEAHHRIDIVNSDGSASSSAISFLCEQFMFEDKSPPVPLPGYLNQSLTAFFASVGMAPKTYDEYSALERSHK